VVVGINLAKNVFALSTLHINFRHRELGVDEPSGAVRQISLFMWELCMARACRRRVAVGAYVPTAMKHVAYAEALSAKARRRIRLLAITIGMLAVGFLLGWFALRLLVAVVTLD
jgi:hypothetical protein